MAKTPSPLLGFNNNVRHKGRIFHIQTEDSGVRYPHVITHLFADGGRIIKSFKTSYAEHVGATNLAETVRSLMKEQHKAMFIALRDGRFDDALDEPDGSALAESGIALRPGQGEAPIPADATPHSAAAAARSPSAQLRVDVEMLEKAAADVQQRSPVFRPDPDLPPPVATAPAERVNGAYRAVSQPSDASPVADDPARARYSAPRPAAIFANARPAEKGTVFGEEVISGRSLDEVILGFLSEEFGEALEPGVKAKK